MLTCMLTFEASVMHRLQAVADSVDTTPVVVVLSLLRDDDFYRFMQKVIVADRAQLGEFAMTKDEWLDMPLFLETDVTLQEFIRLTVPERYEELIRVVYSEFSRQSASRVSHDEIFQRIVLAALGFFEFRQRYQDLP